MLNELEDIYRQLRGLPKLERFDKNVDFKKLRNEGATVLDVRTVKEFNEGHIENAINIPVEELKDRIAEAKKLKQPILAHCRSGRRSGRATKILNKAGIKTFNAGGYKYLIKKL